MRRIRAEWAYTSKAESEISVSKGEIAILVDTSNADWWEIIKADGSAGFVPANFVTLIDEKIPDETENARTNDTAENQQVTSTHPIASSRKCSTEKGPAPTPVKGHARNQSTSCQLPPKPEGGVKPPTPVQRVRSKVNEEIRPSKAQVASPRTVRTKPDTKSDVGSADKSGVVAIQSPSTTCGSAVEDELPEFWVQRTDEVGKKYYLNTQTGKAQWVRPPPLLPGWIMVHDNDGNPYYYNAELQQSRWTRPVPSTPKSVLLDSDSDTTDQDQDSDDGSSRRARGSARTPSKLRIEPLMNPASLNMYDESNEGGTDAPKQMLYESNIQKKIILDKGKKGKKSWESHFAQLKATELLLYKDEKSVRQKKMGTIRPQMAYSLNCAGVEILNDPRKRPIFEIKTREENHFYIQCESDSVVSCWVRAIKINQQALKAEPVAHEYDRPPFMSVDEISKHSHRKTSGETSIRRTPTDKRLDKKKIDKKALRKAEEEAEVERKKEKREAEREAKELKKKMKKSSSSSQLLRVSDSRATLKEELDEIDDSTITRGEKTERVKKRIFKFLQTRPNKEDIGGIMKAPYFGSSIAYVCKIEGATAFVPNVPNLVVLALEQIEKRGIHLEGIYRLSGTSTTIQKIRSLADQGEKIDFAKYEDINTVTGALKLYFRELEDPSIPFALYDGFLEAMKISDYNKRMYEIQAKLAELPRANYETLSYLFTHLKKISTNNAVNKMTASNLAIVFGPTLMKPEVETMSSILNMGYHNNCVELMIEQCEWLFVERSGRGSMADSVSDSESRRGSSVEL